MVEQQDEQQSAYARLRGWAIAFALGFPTLVTLFYFFWLWDSPPLIQLGGYAIAKTIQFGFPIAWLLLDPAFLSHWHAPTNRTKFLGQGIGFGLIVAALMIVAFVVIVQETEAGRSLAQAVQDKMSDAGFNTFARFIAISIFYCVVHSFLEEYYWRWFIFRGCTRIMPFVPAVIISSLGFTIHHVLILSVYFGWGSWLCWAASFTVAVGGAVWALIYSQARTILPVWISHLIVDVGIFGIGLFLMWDTLI